MSLRDGAGNSSALLTSGRVLQALAHVGMWAFGYTGLGIRVQGGDPGHHCEQSQCVGTRGLWQGHVAQE